MKCSLVVMSLKMEQAGKEYQVIKSCKKYPELAIK